MENKKRKREKTRIEQHLLNGDVDALAYLHTDMGSTPSVKQLCTLFLDLKEESTGHSHGQ